MLKRKLKEDPEMYPTMPLNARYTGNRRRTQIRYVNPTSFACAAPRTFSVPSIICVLLLVLTAAFALSRPAYAADLTPTDNATVTANDTYTPQTDTAAILAANLINAANPEPTAPKTLTAPQTTSNLTALKTETKAGATYIYITCPIEAYQGTTYENEPVEYLVDDFEDMPEHWLYVLTPLEDGKSYIFTLDLACRIENSRFEGEITATYNSDVPDDGSLGSIVIEATEEIAPNIFLVYRGELKYISDGSLHLVQNGYGSLYDHHLFYFSLATAEPDLPEGIVPLSEQRISRLSTPSAFANVTIIGNAECSDNVYDTDLLQSDYMYPYKKYEPAEGSRPESAPPELSARGSSAEASDSAEDAAPPETANLTTLIADTAAETNAPPPTEPPAPGREPVEPTTCSDEPIFFLAEYLTPPDLAHPAAV